MNVMNRYKDNWSARHLLALALLCLLCYWPLSLGVFSAKNDNIVQFLPVRFHVSEALRNGHLPLWSPYMYMGYPIHGDMQGGAWNPVVWLVSLFGRYSVTSIHAEILIAIFIAGAGMYRLLGVTQLPARARLTGAGIYLMCGFITDVAGSNLPFLWGAAYAPFVLAYGYLLMQQPALLHAVKLAMALALLLVSAYPSFLIMTGYVLLAGFMVIVVRHLFQKKYGPLKSLLAYYSLAALIFLCLAAAAIISYLQILPFYQRSEGVSLQQAFVNSFHPSCSASLILPSVPLKNSGSFVTDLISRNAYFNIFLLGFVFFYFKAKKTLLLHFLLAGFVFFYLFSLGDFTPVRTWSFQLLPLMDTFRHPSNSRLFVIIAGIVAGLLLFEKYLQKQSDQLPVYLLWAFATVSLISSVVGFTGSTILDKTEMIVSGGPLRDSLKQFLDGLGLHDMLFLNGFIQFIFLVLMIFFLKRKRFKQLAVVLLLNSFVFAQFTIPYTLASKVSPKQINELIKTFPKDYPVPAKNGSIAANSSDVLKHYELIGISGFYNKKINMTDVDFTPTFMIPIQNVMTDSFAKRLLFSNPYAFFAIRADSVRSERTEKTVFTSEPELLNMVALSGGDFRLTGFWNNGFAFRTQTLDSTVFCLQQLYLPGWECRIDGEKAKIHRVNLAFMAVAIPPGGHSVLFVYRPTGVIAGLAISLISLIAVILLIVKFSRKHA